MLMLGPENATTCTWVDLLSSFCLIPSYTHGVPGILPAELGHYLWDLSDLSSRMSQTAGSAGSESSPPQDTLRLTEDVLELQQQGHMREGTKMKHGLNVGVLAISGEKPKIMLEAVAKLSYVRRVEISADDAPYANVHLPNINASLTLPSLSEVKLRGIISSMVVDDPAAVKPSDGNSPWEGGAGMIAAGPDILLLEAPLDVILMGKSLEAFHEVSTKTLAQCFARKDAIFC